MADPIRVTVLRVYPTGAASLVRARDPLYPSGRVYALSPECAFDQVGSPTRVRDDDVLDVWLDEANGQVARAQVVERGQCDATSAVA